MQILIGIGIYLLGLISGVLALGIVAARSYNKGYEHAKSMEKR